MGDLNLPHRGNIATSTGFFAEVKMNNEEWWELQWNTWMLPEVVKFFVYKCERSHAATRSFHLRGVELTHPKDTTIQRRPYTLAFGSTNSPQTQLSIRLAIETPVAREVNSDNLGLKRGRNSPSPLERPLNSVRRSLSLSWPPPAEPSG